jgi:hypothetical protein
VAASRILRLLAVLITGDKTMALDEQCRVYAPDTIKSMMELSRHRGKESSMTGVLGSLSQWTYVDEKDLSWSTSTKKEAMIQRGLETTYMAMKRLVESVLDQFLDRRLQLAYSYVRLLRGKLRDGHIHSGGSCIFVRRNVIRTNQHSSLP